MINNINSNNKKAFCAIFEFTSSRHIWLNNKILCLRYRTKSLINDFFVAHHVFIYLPSENGMFYGCQNLQIDTSTTSTASRASAMSSTASRASTMSYAATSVEEDWDNLQGYCLQRQYLG